MKTAFILLSAFYCLFTVSQPSDSTTLKIQVDNLKSMEGQLGVLIFDTKNGYPDRHEEAYRSMFIPIEEPLPLITVDNLPYGNYTITIMHDENSNGVFDKNTFSVPKEGYGVSNNPKPRFFGPPHFADGNVKVSSDNMTLNIKMIYRD